jgi:hypothetical protein
VQPCTAQHDGAAAAYLAVWRGCSWPEAYICCQSIVHFARLGVTQHIKGCLQRAECLAAASLVWMQATCQGAICLQGQAEEEDGLQGVVKRI